MAKKASRTMRGRSVRKKQVPQRKTARQTRRAATPVRKSAAKRRPAAAAPMDQEAMMAAWQRFMTPSEGHRRLEPMVGTWQAKVTFVMAPKAPPAVSEGTSEHRWVLGGRYLEQRFTGSMMEMPFEGLGYTAYDNAVKKYVGTWMDNMGTGIMVSTGTGRPRDTQMDFEADAVEPTGKPVKFLCKMRVQDPDHHSYEMWATGPDGKRYRSLFIEYTRK
jgi:hypothetical protein